MRAAVLASVILAVVSGLAVYALLQRNAAIRNAVRADRNSQVANARTVEANNNLYVANMNLVQQDWETSNIGRLRQMLADTRNHPDKGFEWYYLQRLCHLDRMTLRGHTGGVSAVAFSPDGKR